MNVTLKVDNASINRFNDALKLYVEGLGKDAEETTIKYTKIALQDIMDRTPPFAGKNAEVTSLQKGTKAVLRDIRKTMSLVDANDFDSPSIQKMIRKQDLDGFNKAIKNFPKLRDKEAVPFSPTIHTSARRYGKVPKGYTSNKLILNKSEYKKYEKEIVGHVGKLKSSWAEAVLRVKGRVPLWVRRHLGFGTRVTQVIDQLSTPAHKITINNICPGIGRMSSYASYAIGYTAEKMKKDIEFKMHFLKKKVGFKK